MYQSVCRLCCSRNNLIWVFEPTMAANTTEIIKTTCGVEVLRQDLVSQRICSTCRDVTRKMYEFRQKALTTDIFLKAKLAEAQAQEKREKPKKTYTKKRPAIPPKYINAHPSIKSIINKYPNLKLPELPLNAHCAPYITLLTDEVDEYFAEFEKKKNTNPSYKSSPTSSNKRIKLSETKGNKELPKISTTPDVKSSDLSESRANQRVDGKQNAKKASPKSIKSPQPANKVRSFLKKSTGARFKSNKEVKKEEVEPVLLSTVNRSYTMHICTFCDVQHYTLRDLQLHIKRTHTKCPFCNARFSNPQLRDQHMKLKCAKNKPRLVLISSEDDDDVKPKRQKKSEDRDPNPVRVVDRDLVKGFNEDDDDVKTLKTILVQKELRSRHRKMFHAVTTNHPISKNAPDSNHHIFKDFRQQLLTFKVPIEVSLGTELKLDYNLAASPPAIRKDFWYSITPKRLQEYSPEQLPQLEVEAESNQIAEKRSCDLPDENQVPEKESVDQNTERESDSLPERESDDLPDEKKSDDLPGEHQVIEKGSEDLPGEVEIPESEFDYLPGENQISDDLNQICEKEFGGLPDENQISEKDLDDFLNENEIFQKDSDENQRLEKESHDLPDEQGPLPVIESVMSLPKTATNSLQVAVPIRVKPINELF